MKTTLMFAAAAVVAGSASAGIRITEWAYSAAPGEWVELTNVGATAIDMTGWSYDDDSRAPGSQSLSAFGIVQPGESVIFTEATEAAFRTGWGLAASVKIIGGVTNNLARNDEINIFDASNAVVDRLTYGDQIFPGTIRTQNISGWAYRDLSAPFGNVNSSWVFSSIGDAQGSFAGPSGNVGSPGRYVPTPGAVALLAMAGMAGRRRRA